MFVLFAAADLDPGYGTLIALCIFIAASVWLGTLAQKVVRGSSFVKGYFLGNRGLGAWAVALTATVQSGGTFMGFPSLVYSHGWIVALWIGSYMVVPITGFGLIGKRVAHLSRATGAITMPDLFRLRFASPALGLVTSLLIIVFLSSMLVAQFKAGATVMKLAWPGSGILALSEEPTVAPSVPSAQGDATTAKPTGLQGLFASVDRAYLLGLVIFSITVVGYTLDRRFFGGGLDRSLPKRDDVYRRAVALGDGALRHRRPGSRHAQSRGKCRSRRSGGRCRGAGERRPGLARPLGSRSAARAGLCLGTGLFQGRPRLFAAQFGDFVLHLLAGDRVCLAGERHADHGL
jgi:hypothetical protein